jgi:hypothetical protein
LVEIFIARGLAPTLQRFLQGETQLLPKQIPTNVSAKAQMFTWLALVVTRPRMPLLLVIIHCLSDMPPNIRHIHVYRPHSSMLR